MRTMKTETENWKPVRGTDYEVSSGGRVRRGKKLLSCRVDNLGYVRCNIRVPVIKKRTVHSLVAEAFIGPRPVGKEVHHINGDKTDNRPANLAYVTHSENLHIDFALGRRAWPKGNGIGRKHSPETRAKMRDAKLGSRHPRAVDINPETVIALHDSGMTHQDIAQRCGVGSTTIHSILAGTHWSQREAN